MVCNFHEVREGVCLSLPWILLAPTLPVTEWTFGRCDQNASIKECRCIGEVLPSPIGIFVMLILQQNKLSNNTPLVSASPRAVVFKLLSYVSPPSGNTPHANVNCLYYSYFYCIKLKSKNALNKKILLAHERKGKLTTVQEALKSCLLPPSPNPFNFHSPLCSLCPALLSIVRHAKLFPVPVPLHTLVTL